MHKWVHHRYLPGAKQIDLFMHFLGASRDGLVARRVDLDTISSSVYVTVKTSEMCYSSNIIFEFIMKATLNTLNNPSEIKLG